MKTSDPNVLEDGGDVKGVVMVRCSDTFSGCFLHLVLGVNRVG